MTENTRKLKTLCQNDKGPWQAARVRGKVCKEVVRPAVMYGLETVALDKGVPVYPRSLEMTGGIGWDGSRWSFVATENGSNWNEKRRRFLLGVTYLVIYITCKSELGTFIFQLAEIALVSYLTKHWYDWVFWRNPQGLLALQLVEQPHSFEF